MLRKLSRAWLLRHHSRGVPIVVVILMAIGGDRLPLLLNGAEEAIAEAAVTLEMRADPPLEQIIPDTRPVQLTFTAFADGKPLGMGRLMVQVSAPPRPMLLSTPFPAVEGTTLLQLSSDLADGKFAVEYLFPMQGVYAFDVDLMPAPNGQTVPPMTFRQSVQVPADPASRRRAWFFRAVLFSMGGLAGVWYARSAHPWKTPPSRAAVATAALVFAGLVGITSPFTFADHGPRELVFPKGAQVIQGDDGWALNVRPTPEQAVVGELLELAVTLTHKGQVFAGAMDVAMHLYNLKDDQTILRTTVVAPHGSTSQRFQLVESVPHTCTVTARPAGGESGRPMTLTAVVGIDVLPAYTPITVKLRVMGLFVGVVGAGMAGGFLLGSGVRKLPGRVKP